MATATHNDFWLTTSDLAAFLGESPEKLRGQVLRMQPKLKFTSLVPPHVVRAILEDRGYKYPRKVVSVQMLKGGVAKTTTVLNLGIRAAMYGAKVLFVDLDQQANLSFALGVDGEDKIIWLDIVEKKAKIAEAIVPVSENIDLVPSSLNNSVLDRVLLSSNRNWAQAVRGPLDWVRGKYDLILIDTAPAISAVNTAVTVASDEVIFPVNPDRFSMLGLKKSLDELNEVRKDFDLIVRERILFTRFDKREKASHGFLEYCLDTYPDALMKSYIRTSSDFKNSVERGRTVFANKGPAKEDYDLATQELMGFETKP
ncbi:MAG: ParA family protein [Bdellovibrionaceae bacterium]|nr:ParA family protein [Pseudobdellovibrionaceae bacterium]